MPLPGAATAGEDTPSTSFLLEAAAAKTLPTRARDAPLIDLDADPVDATGQDAPSRLGGADNSPMGLRGAQRPRPSAVFDGWPGVGLGRVSGRGTMAASS